MGKKQQHNFLKQGEAANHAAEKWPDECEAEGGHGDNSQLEARQKEKITIMSISLNLPVQHVKTARLVILCVC